MRGARPFLVSADFFADEPTLEIVTFGAVLSLAAGGWIGSPGTGAGSCVPGSAGCGWGSGCGCGSSGLGGGTWNWRQPLSLLPCVEGQSSLNVGTPSPSG